MASAIEKNEENEDNLRKTRGHRISQYNQEVDLDPITLSFENLTVHVPESGLQCFKNLLWPMTSFIKEYLGMSVDHISAFNAITNVSGYVHQGEMCLVLGPSGSGKSTLLRAICGRLTENDELSGKLCLSGAHVQQENNQHLRRISSYVSARDDEHCPALSVGETFEFAARCTCTDEEQNKERVRVILELLGLSHVKDTVVGDENLRGVSGGQKRRVSVGEMFMNTQKCMMVCDNITDGLASTDSSDLIRNMSKACKEFGFVAVVTLLQPSDEIIQEFDKVLVLKQSGEMDYFGPPDRVTLEEFFGSDTSKQPSETDQVSGGIADLIESERSPFTTKEEYLKSSMYLELQQTLRKFRENANEEEVLSKIFPKERYATSAWYQFKIISMRRKKLIFRNAMTYMRPCIAIFFGIIVGSLFSSLNNDFLGALGRSGYLYLSGFLVFMLSTAVTIPDYFRERNTTFKHRGSEFYSGRIMYISQVVCDLPLSLIEAVLVSIISYYWIGMNSGVNSFFFFLVTLIGLECVGQALSRLLCSILRVQLAAKTAASLIIFFSGAVSGFMPTYAEIPWIFRWLSWLNPMSYAFEAIMINEFDNTMLHGLVITDKEGDINLGQVSGNVWMTIQSIPRVAYGSNSSIKHFDLFMIFVFAIVFDVIGRQFVEITRGWYHNQVRKPQPKVRSFEILDKTDYDEEEAQKKEKKPRNGNEPQSISIQNDWPQALSIVDLKYTVFKGKAKKITMASLLGPCIAWLSKKDIDEKEQVMHEKDSNGITLLNGVTAHFKRGHMTALMGQSGAGKTTLMDVIAGYKTGGEITGGIFIDGTKKRDDVWRKISGYAEQNDILNPYLSVLETLEFTASCRLPDGIDKRSVISKILKLMDLEAYSDSLIGREQMDEGLPKHARKRLTIANQLVILPKILFLDEPTSGLGTNSASLVIQAIRRATDSLGLITLATIHQPSRAMFETFDDLLLLAKGGRLSFFGPLGSNSHHVLDYFSLLQVKMEKMEKNTRQMTLKKPPTWCNPADYVLRVLDNGDPDLAVSEFHSSEKFDSILSEIELSKEKSKDCPTTFVKKNDMALFFFLLRRQFVVEWRNPSYSILRMSVSVGASLFLGILFFDIKPEIQGAIFTIASINFFVFMLSIPMQSAVVPLIEDRAVLYREVVSGTYDRIAYGLSQLVADLFFHAINTVLMFIFFYFLVSFRKDAESMGYFMLMLFFSNWVSTSIGQCYAYSSPNEETASGLSGLSTILSVIFMGFLITYTFMPDGWKWANWANLFRYIMQGLVTNQIAGEVYHIDLGLNLTKATSSSAIIFESSSIPPLSSIATQLSNFVGLVDMVDPDRYNETAIYNNTDLDDIKSLIKCMTDNKCLVEPVLDNFVSCNVFNFPRGPPCGDEFDLVMSDADIGQCFSSFVKGGVGSLVGGLLKRDISLESFTNSSKSSKINVVSCLVGNILPANFLAEIGKIASDLYNIVMVVIDILDNGIMLPANLILFFFGWARFEDGEFVAPFKWHYCMTSVVIFLSGIEVLKLISLRFIVWTKR